MPYKFLIFLVVLALIFGCTEYQAPDQYVLDLKSKDYQENTTQPNKTVQEPITQEGQDEENNTDSLPEVYPCETSDDCILIVPTNCICDDCKQHGLEDPDVIAVNKNMYQCPTRPNDTLCIACVGTISFDPEKDAVCRDGACIKKDYSIISHETNEISAIVGTRLNISLGWNPTTGFSHVVKQIDKELINITGTYSEPSPLAPCTGCGGSCIFEIEPLMEGEGILTLYYCQDWQCEGTLIEIKQYVFRINSTG